MEKTQVYISKPLVLVFKLFSIFGATISKKLMYEFWYFWYDYVKPRYRLFNYEFSDIDYLIMNSLDDCLNEKIDRLIKDDISPKIMIKFLG